MNVARASVVCVANQEIHISNDGWLIGKVTNVGGEVITGNVSGRQFDRTLSTGRETFDESLNFGEGGFFHDGFTTTV